MTDAADGEIERFLRSHGSFEAPPMFPDGRCVGDWKVLAFLGRGGSAEVYRAEIAVTGIVGALKVLFRADDRSRERFRQETRLVAETKSASFPKFYGAGEYDGHLFIAEELLEPIELPSDDAAVGRFILGVAVGVEELHRRGFVHRDLKPGNVMSRPSTGESVLIDMGLAKENGDAPQTRNETVSVVDGHAVGVGTPGFSAPEQFTGGKVSSAMDIHALGMLVNACFGGMPPKAWVAIIRRSTSSVPELRYSSVAEFVRAVRHRHAARRWCTAIITSLVAAGTLFGLYQYRNGKQEDHEEPQPKVVVPESRVSSTTNPVVHTTNAFGATNAVVHVASLTNDGVKNAHVPSLTNVVAHNVSTKTNDLLALGRTTSERGLLVTRIALGGKDVSLPGDIKLKGKRRIEISGYGRLTASISGSRDVRLELSDRATLINLTTIPYPRSGMRYVLKGPCYLNFKNLDPPQDDDIKNIWVDNYDGKGEPSFRFRGTDSYEEVRKEDKAAALDAMRKGIMPSY